MYARRDIETVRLYNQIVRMSSDRLTIKVYDIVEGGQWSGNLQHIVNTTENSENFKSRSVLNIRVTKIKLMEMYKTVWKQDVESKSKLSLYAKTCTDYQTANYIKCNLSKCKRSLLSRLRCGILPLAVETCRYQGLQKELRICQLCKANRVEDELNFLFDCNATNNMRIKLYHKIPELLNTGENIERYWMLTNMPYTFANYVDELWSARLKSITT